MTSYDSDTCRITILDYRNNQTKGVLDRWSQYSFTSDFLTPADAFHFSVEAPEFVKEVSGILREGLTVALHVNNARICTGVIDEVAMASDRSSGTVFECSGRDMLGIAIDASIDPFQKFDPSQSLEQVISTVLKPFGLSTLYTDNSANLAIRSSNKFGAPQKKPSVSGKRIPVVKKGSGGPTKKFLEHQAKPYPGEGAYEFVHRLAKRAGLHVWCMADGSGVVVGKPDFKQEPSFKLIRRLSGFRGSNRGNANNIISGAVKYSRLNQPTLIMAGAKSRNGDFSTTPLRAWMVNNSLSIGANGEEIEVIKDFRKKFTTAYEITDKDFDETEVAPAKSKTPFPFGRPMYLVDNEAQTKEQLINFVKREMATRTMQSVEVHYRVMGHTQDGKVWATDTVALIEDDVANLYEPMWIKSVTFNKSRTGGTTTDLSLIRLGSLRL